MKMKKEIRTWAVVLKDKFIREPAFIKNNLIRGVKDTNKAGFVFCVDGLLKHGGLFDQFKGMISVYASAKAQGIPFYLNYSYLINLERYLMPNTYDWRIDEKDVSKTSPFVKPIIMFGEYKNPYRLIKRYDGHQVHFYYGFDSVEDVNQKFGTTYEWGTLYHELFRPTDILQQQIDDLKEAIGEKYVAVHLRFMNLLGDNNERIGENKVLDEVERLSLIQQCRKKIIEIGKENGDSRVLIASDSNVFLDYISDEPQVFIVPGRAKHIDNIDGMSEDDDIKLFLDYYALAGAGKVYSIVGENMYRSAFPEYSAKIGGCKFERISL
jgi:hypothetical protein